MIDEETDLQEAFSDTEEINLFPEIQKQVEEILEQVPPLEKEPPPLKSYQYVGKGLMCVSFQKPRSELIMSPNKVYSLDITNPAVASWIRKGLLIEQTGGEQ